MRQLRTHATQAIVLKRINYGEADRILTLLTPDLGKITALARGVRKLKSRKRGHIELFNHSKTHLAKGKQLYILTEAEVITPFTEQHLQITPSQKIGTAYHFAELVNRLVPEEEPQPEIFTLTQKSFNYLSSPTPDLLKLHRGFKLRLLQLMGFWPNKSHPPADLDAYIESILERPLQTNSFLLSL